MAAERVIARELARGNVGMADRVGVVGTPAQICLLCFLYPEAYSEIATVLS